MLEYIIITISIIVNIVTILSFIYTYYRKHGDLYVIISDITHASDYIDFTLVFINTGNKLFTITESSLNFVSDSKFLQNKIENKITPFALGYEQQNPLRVRQEIPQCHQNITVDLVFDFKYVDTLGQLRTSSLCGGKGYFTSSIFKLERTIFSKAKLDGDILIATFGSSKPL